MMMIAYRRWPARRRSGGRLVAGALVLAGWLAAPEARAQTQRQIGRYTVTERMVGSWLLKSSSGPLGAYCTIERRAGGQTFGYQVTRAGERYVGLSSEAWRRAPGTFETLRLTVGGATLWSGRAAAPVPDSLLLPIKPGQRDLAAILSRADSAQAEMSGQVTRFDLSGAAEALQAQRTCLAGAR